VEPSAGAHLVQHPEVDKVAFTGSTPAGRLIGELCGRLCARSHSNWVASRRCSA
jgi:acyl-CoA reductase-like NAD-dependent aldehyde dehydrogenase